MILEMCLRKEWREKLPVTAYYRPGQLQKPLCVNPWADRPTRRNKWVMFNCAKYRAVWLPDQEKLI